MTPAVTVTLLLLSSLMTYDCDATRVEVLTPVRTNGTEVGLIIVPGAFIAGHAYRPLGEAIQSNCTARLWVALLEDFLLHLANPLQIGGAVDQAVSKFKATGFTSDAIFIAGHSLGGGVVSQYVQSHSSGFRGAFFFGHYPDFTLSQFPLPIMTLSGDLDGLVRVTHMMDKFLELSRDMQTDFNALYRTPVLLVKGVNHGHFASGDMPDTVRQNDLSADVTEVTAHALIASYVSDFLLLHVPGQRSTDVTETKMRLEQAYFDTRDIYQPLQSTRALDENEAMMSQTSVIGQTLVAGVTSDHITITDRVVASTEIRSQQPTMVSSGQRVEVSTVTQVVHDSKLLGQSYSPVSPRELQVKLVSRRAILKALQSNGTDPTVTSPQSCRSLNQNTLMAARMRSSTTARGRYDTRGSKMVLLPDLVTSDIDSWLRARLDFRQSASNVSVRAAVYTSDTEPPGGLQFCKLLSPYRALEWIYVDSLRPQGQSTSVLDLIG